MARGWTNPDLAVRPDDPEPVSAVRGTRTGGAVRRPVVAQGRAHTRCANRYLEDELTTTRSLPRVLTFGAIFVFAAAACGGGASPTPSEGPKGYDEFAPDATLLAAAKDEGNLLTAIALPDSWCGYGKVISTFETRTGIDVNVLNPDAGSAQELEAIEANKDNPGPAAPDVIDVGLSFGPQAKEAGQIQPYKVKTWDTIPATAKDEEGYWYGDYYGVLAFEINKDAVENIPADWADLLKDEYESQVALAGDPRLSSQAINAVFAASLANGGSLDDASKGLEFFKDLNAKGNFVPVIGKTGTVAQGETPIRIAWTYNALGDRDTLAGNPEIEVVVPASGRFAGVYVQAISAYAPHLNAAKLWMDYLYSDEGQNLWLEGYCHPIRYEDLVANNKVPQAQLDALPDVRGAQFPTLDQINAAAALITGQWDSVVGADVTCTLDCD
jgi:putative spermidine/putrescine transport system substrate-binding protein